MTESHMCSAPQHDREPHVLSICAPSLATLTLPLTPRPDLQGGPVSPLLLTRVEVHLPCGSLTIPCGSIALPLTLDIPKVCLYYGGRLLTPLVTTPLVRACEALPQALALILTRYNRPATTLARTALPSPTPLSQPCLALPGVFMQTVLAGPPLGRHQLHGSLPGLHP